MKNGLVLVSCLLVIAALAGCGQVSNPASTTPSTVAAGTFSISGTLNSGTIRTAAVSAAGVKSLATAASAISSYAVVAVGTIDKKVYFPDADTDSAGSFKISNLPSGESFYLEILNDTNKFVAPVAFGTKNSSLVMAVSAEGASSLDLGSVVYESAKGTAIPATEPTANLDDDSIARSKVGGALLPVGAGSLGRGVGEAALSGSPIDKVDEDTDGLPDVVDIDDDGDGKVDGLDPSPRRTGAIEIKVAGVSNVNAFTNLAVQYENYPTYRNGALNSTPPNPATNTTLAIEIVMESGTSPDLFSDVRIVEGPAWIDTATISSTNTPSLQGTLWKNNSYKLEKESDRWDIHVIPNATPEAGDILKFKTTNASTGAEEYFIATLTFIFTDIPRLVSYTDSISTKEGVALDLATYEASSRRFDYTGSTVTFSWTAPKDDLGSSVTGMLYYLDGITYHSGSSSTSGGNVSFTPTERSDPTFGTVYSYTFTPSTTPFDYFKVDIKAQSPLSGGGNASQMVNFQ
ncbi:MAG: hypothetical protein WC645_01510 [Candidatus Margulisiibacteriota bacterium]